MKSIKILIIFLLATHLSKAQDSTVILSASMLEQFNTQINLSALNGWHFKQRNGIELTDFNTDTIGWQKLKPSELSSKYADKNGRVEGWFRIVLRFDSTLANKNVAIDFPQWAATEMYLDDKLVASRGNIGSKAEAFVEYLGDIDPFPINFESATPHYFVIHFVSYISSLPPHALKSNGQQLVLAGPNYFTRILKYTRFLDTFMNLWVITCTVLSILFWLLYFQNRNEKNLFWIALCTTVLTIAVFCEMAQTTNGITYFRNRTYFCISNFSIRCFLIILIPLLLAKVFKRKMSNKLLIILIISFAYSFIILYLPGSGFFYSEFVQSIPIIISLIVCVYYVVSSWKNLNGAQWSIVVGLVFSIFLFLLIVLSSLNKNFINSRYLFLSFLTCFILSLPTSLLVYVSLRFKEIIKEVQLNATRVVDLSEEKKLRAENEQKILQEEVNKQTSELRHTLDDLKSTQSQLIQSEKMASLGELTAGIAHEIQNPLNFVNNFSEVSNELIDEMNVELDKGDINEAKLIAADVKNNLEKINHHGKRADAIVKGMLQHSRSTSGVKEQTDINALCDEYLRLSYHGLRAKDKSFNATMKTDFDNSIGTINIIPQDIGRVVLNLLTNAFYVVDEKKKLNIPGYEPSVTICTSRSPLLGRGAGGEVTIKVTDNGNGIPQNIVDKIFQPFFTTKPTGQGTGLGLSLSYDIIKAHGGDIKVQSETGSGSTFIIQLPLTN